MQQFVVTFKIAKNITAPVGEKMVYVRIMKPDDDILVKSRADVFAFEGKEINYSMKKMIEYEGEGGGSDHVLEYRGILISGYLPCGYFL